jgi:hypothetical protein
MAGGPQPGRCFRPIAVFDVPADALCCHAGCLCLTRANETLMQLCAMTACRSSALLNTLAFAFAGDENRGRRFLDGKIASLYRLASSREGARLRSAFGHVLKLKRRARERQATKLKTMKRSFDWVKPGEKTAPTSSDVGEVVRTDESDESLCGAVAQLGERCVRNAEVGGSNPLGSTITWVSRAFEEVLNRSQNRVYRGLVA